MPTFSPASGSGAKLFDTNYINETRDQLLGKIVLEGDTIDFAHVIPGVKNRMSLNNLDEVGSVSDATCGWPAAPGDIELSQKELVVYPKEIKDSICQKNLEATYLGEFMSTNKEIPFSGVVANKYAAKGNKFAEDFIWKGDYVWSTHTAGTQDGLLYQICGSSAAVDASTAVQAAATWIGKINAMVSACPVEILDRKDLVICVSYAQFISYQQELIAANLFHYDANIASKMELYVPGTNIMVKAVAGLNNTAKVSGKDGELIIMTYKENIVVGTDMMNDEEKFDMWYSKDNDEFRVNVQFKIGATTRFEDFVVRGYANDAL